jgi:hypothetical protein
MVRSRPRSSDRDGKGVACSALEPKLRDDGRSRPLHPWHDRQAHQALLQIEWLSSKIHSAVMSELGLSLQKRKSDVEMARTAILKILVDECKARMRGDGEQPRGGIPAVAEITAGQGMTRCGLKEADHSPTPRK